LKALFKQHLNRKIFIEKYSVILNMLGQLFNQQENTNRKLLK